MQRELSRDQDILKEDLNLSNQILWVINQFRLLKQQMSACRLKNFSDILNGWTSRKRQLLQRSLANDLFIKVPLLKQAKTQLEALAIQEQISQK